MKTFLEHLINLIGLFIILVVIEHKRDTKLVDLKNKDFWKYTLWIFIAIVLIKI